VACGQLEETRGFLSPRKVLLFVERNIINIVERKPDKKNNMFLFPRFFFYKEKA